jgi:hypothetical protein
MPRENFNLIKGFTRLGPPKRRNSSLCANRFAMAPGIAAGAAAAQPMRRGGV